MQNEMETTILQVHLGETVGGGGLGLRQALSQHGARLAALEISSASGSVGTCFPMKREGTGSALGQFSAQGCS